MYFVATFFFSLVIIISPAQAWTYKGKEKVVVDAQTSAYREAFGNNFQMALAECERARSAAGGDKYLLGIVELCAAGVEDERNHRADACSHYSSALTFWRDLPPPAAGDAERDGKLREWTQLIVLHRKSNKCH